MIGRSGSGSDKEETRSCLAVVEADGLFDGRRRVRLRLRSRSKPSSVQQQQLEDEERLLDLKRSLTEELEFFSVSPSMVELELYDPRKESFARLETIESIPSTCCRLRIIVVAAGHGIGGGSSNNNSSNIDEPLALPWREFSSSIDLEGKLVLKGGRHSIAIKEVSNSGLGTGTNIWDGAIALAKFLEYHDGDNNDNNGNNQNHNNNHSKDDCNYSVRGKRVLELGSGTGLVGIAAHVAFGAKEVVLTDLEYSMNNLRENVRENLFGDIADACGGAAADGDDFATDDPPNPVQGTNLGARSSEKATTTAERTIDARVLDWSDVRTCHTALGSWTPEVVLAADVVWVESLVRPLVECLHHICLGARCSFQTTLSAAPSPLVLLSYQRRSQAVEDLLFRTLEKFSFRAEDVTSSPPPLSSAASKNTPPAIPSTSKIRIYRIAHARVHAGACPPDG